MKSKILKFLTLAAAFCGMTAWGAIETQEAFVTACANAVSGDTLELGSGEFAIGPVDINGKTLTFKGQGAVNTKVYIGNGGYDGNGGHGSSKTANMTFEDVTLDDLASNSGYLTGFTEAAGLTFRNVTFNVGFSNWGNKGGDVSFYNCTFNQSVAGKYCVQELRSANGTKYLFDTCTFNCTAEGRFINAYKQGGDSSKIEITVKDCTFNNTGSSSKAVLNLKDESNGCIIDLTFIGTNTANGSYPSSAPSALFQGTSTGWATVYLKDTAESDPVTIYANNTKQDDWVDPNGYTPASAAPAVAKIGTTEYSDLAEALNAAVTANANVTVEILDDIDLAGTTWTPVSVDGAKNPGAWLVTVNGNNHTVSGLSDMLFGLTWAGHSGLVINDLTIKDSTIVHDQNDAKGTEGVGAFVGYPQASEIVTLNNCHLVDSSVEGGHWTGGLIGAAAGYNGNDGPVFTTVTITGCSVENSTVKGKGSVGALIGHGTQNAATKVVIADTKASGNTISGASASKTGILMGTVGAAGTVAAFNGQKGGIELAVTESGNTVKVNDSTVASPNEIGRIGSTGGVVTIKDGSYTVDPTVTSDPTVGTIAPKENFEVAQNAAGAYVLDEAKVAKIGDVKYETLADAVAAAQAGDTVEILVADTYKVPNLPANITIKGVVEDVVFDCVGTGNIASVPNGATFENVKFVFGNGGNYHGFQHAGAITMKNCELNGLLFSYGDMVFDTCTFTQETTEYCMWCYAGNITYKDCVINCNGKFANVYNEGNDGGTPWRIVAEGCEFNSSKVNKAAFNVKETCGAKMLKYDVEVKGCTANENFPSASTDKTGTLYVINALVQVDDRKLDAESGITVKMSENQNATGDALESVYPLPKEVAQIGDTVFSSINAAFAAVNGQSGDDVTIKILKDVTEELTTDYEFAKNVTLSTDVEDGVTVNLGFVYGRAVLGLLATQGHVLNIEEDVTITNLSQLFGGYYHDSSDVVNIGGIANLQQLWACWDDVVNVLPTARIVMGYGDGMIKLRCGALNVTGTANDAADKQLTGGYITADNNGAKSLNLKDTYVSTAWLVNSGTGTITLDMDNATLELNHESSNGLNLGADATSTINMKNGSLIVTPKLQNVDVINVDATGLTTPVKVIDYTGTGAMTLADYGTVNVENGVAYVEDNDLFVRYANFVAQIGTTKYETLEEAIAAAQTGDTVKVLVADTYTLPNLPKNIIIKGTVEGVAFNSQGSGSIASVPNGATFENVTFTLGNTNYHGFQHAGTINMNGCTVNGLLFSYGDMNFTECTFKQTENNYCMWCYGKDVTYTDCTFDTAGKALNVYNEGNDAGSPWNITVDGCTFNSTVKNKAAVNIKETCGAKMLKYNVTVTDCTTETPDFYPTGTEFDPANALWIISPFVQVDDRNTSVYPSESGITVTKGSELVYPMVTMLQLPVTADDGTKLLLTVPDTFFTGVVTYPAGATAAQKAEAQSAHLDDATVDANGLKVWQNYAMGVDGSSAGNTLTTDYAVGAGEWITVKTPIAAFNPPADSGITVTYRLLRTTTPEDAASWVAFGEPLDTPAFPVDLSTQTGDTYWKIEAVFSGEAANE